MNPPSFTRAWVRQCATMTDTIPQDVLTIARHCLLDWLSVLHAGWSHRAISLLAAAAQETAAKPVATLLGSGQRTSLYEAAAINGAAAHMLDFDDAHLVSRIHPSAPLWPAILALAEQQNSDGQAMLRAFVTGVEAQSRLAAVMGESHYQLGWHNTATLGTFGATLAAAQLLKLDEDQTVTAMAIAASLAAGVRGAFGSDVKPLQVGNAASNGIRAAKLAASGYQATEDALSASHGFLNASSQQQQWEIDRQRWHSRQIVFKYHASCYGTQAPIEAALQVQYQDDRLPVIVEVETQYLSVCNIRHPATVAQAKFSIAHMVAMALLRRDTLTERSLSASLNDSAIVALRDRVEVSGNDALARANARLGYGAEWRQIDLSQPATDLILQQEKLLQKSSRLLHPLMPVTHYQRLQQVACRLEGSNQLHTVLPQLMGLTCETDETALK
ncbi:MmgE/PrpD family protein [Erwiniaceae bacterium BAC15a-03b]|uniref:MmgE/PrpD family protein n=1 Tax=Winslowiella arboricola TaxID=2978220 RepID=A0A9J6PX89_9GAMM|nr:MmgE/PrpD family protein [Winslowiella arboricola]MCU5775681.1 MmgE/PrpD family protein [Winslowiella arboricola]MCU5779468.1 MmgE/PrpD family protein [Winslowiella arboricola]